MCICDKIKCLQFSHINIWPEKKYSNIIIATHQSIPKQTNQTKYKTKTKNNEIQIQKAHYIQQLQQLHQLHQLH